MKRQELAENIAAKLKKIRLNHHFSISDMAQKIKINRNNCARNENSRSIPNIFTLLNIAYHLNISLDWLLLDKGSMYLTEKTEEIKTKADAAAPQSPPIPDDLKELLFYMEKIPLLRHEILVQFYRFKEANQDVVQRAIAANLE